MYTAEPFSLMIGHFIEIFFRVPSLSRGYFFRAKKYFFFFRRSSLATKQQQHNYRHTFQQSMEIEPLEEEVAAIGTLIADGKYVVPAGVAVEELDGGVVGHEAGGFEVRAAAVADSDADPDGDATEAKAEPELD